MTDQDKRVTELEKENKYLRAERDRLCSLVNALNKELMDNEP